MYMKIHFLSQLERLKCFSHSNKWMSLCRDCRQISVQIYSERFYSIFRFCRTKEILGHCFEKLFRLYLEQSWDCRRKVAMGIMFNVQSAWRISVRIYWSESSWKNVIEVDEIVEKFSNEKFKLLLTFSHCFTTVLFSFYSRIKSKNCYWHLSLGVSLQLSPAPDNCFTVALPANNFNSIRKKRKIAHKTKLKKKANCN